MINEIIGREREIGILQSCTESDKAEFIAVYGRRRIGKTFLVKQFYGDHFDFYTSGIYQGSRRDQLALFNKQLNKYADSVYPLPNTWFEAFDQLEHYISNLKKDRVILFFDELPWMDVPRSKFLQALESFWNMFASTRKNLKLIVCGSATTWMMSKLIGNKGGLYNRLTCSIKLEAFTLRETETYLKHAGIDWPRGQIVDCYMTMGGTPYYLSMLKKNLSVYQNIDNLYFSIDAPLRSEYTFLFRSLFNDSNNYRNVVNLLAKHAQGMTRSEIRDALKMPDGGMLTEILNNLCSCDFVRRYSGFGKKERDVMYQLCDLYILFYLRFIAGTTHHDSHTWSNMIDNPTRRAWSGYAFEQVCFAHVNQLKQALGISGILSHVCSWRSNRLDSKSQIDMVIDRRDQVINLCEMKYSMTPYEITKDYYRHLIERQEQFRSETRTRKALMLTMVSALGLKPNTYSSAIPKVITLDDLFV
jgi:hypothetical protein